jgi:hypothetical protein
MPQPKKYASPAERQAAFRARREQGRQAEAAAKGLPALPSIPSIPGWPRWNAAFQAAHQLIAQSLREMQDYCEERSESWQESERGEQHQEKIASVEVIQDALSDLIA